jgi:PPP family 3-phenylpropionic acid transporter
LPWALLLTALRWGVIADLTGGLALLLLAQLLHAASYGALHALSVQYIHGYFGQAHHGQGQALYSGLSFGAGGAVGAWMSGLLVEYLGTGAAFWGGAVAATLALLVAWWGIRAPAESR